MLKALGMEHWKAKELACSRKGYWRMAKVLNQIFSNQIIAKLGCPSMLDYYLPPRLYLFDYNQLIFICAKPIFLECSMQVLQSVVGNMAPKWS